MIVPRGELRKSICRRGWTRAVIPVTPSPAGSPLCPCSKVHRPRPLSLMTRCSVSPIFRSCKVTRDADACRRKSRRTHQLVREKSSPTANRRCDCPLRGSVVCAGSALDPTSRHRGTVLVAGRRGLLSGAQAGQCPNSSQCRSTKASRSAGVRGSPLSFVCACHMRTTAARPKP